MALHLWRLQGLGDAADVDGELQGLLRVDDRRHILSAGYEQPHLRVAVPAPALRLS
jgi:hypothetical protein